MSQHSQNGGSPTSGKSASLLSTAHQFACWNLAGAALIAALAIVAYLPSLNGAFISDDTLLVTNNRLIRASDGLYRIWFTTEPVDYWPVTYTMFWVEWRLWGRNPMPYHMVNLALHIAAALLVWAILRKLSIPGAWLAAVLFMVHPVNVESVAWISQRKNTLSMLFFLLSICWYLKADPDSSKPEEQRRLYRPEGPARRGWYWLSLTSFVLSMLSKGSVAILPVILLGLAWWRRGRLTWWDIVRTVPFFLVGSLLAAVNVWFQTHGATEFVRHATWLERLLGAGAVVWFYLGKALAPVHLLFRYPLWDIQTRELKWWIPLAACIAVTGLLIWQRHKPWCRALLFAWGFFCVALLPVMGFTDIGAMQYSPVADRYLHIAIIAVVALVAAGLALWSQRKGKPALSAASCVAAALAGVLTLLSWQQSRLYGDPVKLFAAVVANDPSRHMAYNVGTLYQESGRPMEAIEYFELALRMDPEYPEAHNNLGLALLQTGRLQESIEHFQQALRLKPDYPQAHNNLGTALANSGRSKEAIRHFEEAVRLGPDNAQSRVNLGKVLSVLGRPADAIEHFQAAVELAPGSSEANYWLALTLNILDRPEEAIQYYQRALELNPTRSDAYAGLAKTYARLNLPEQAIAAAQRALKMAQSNGQTELVQSIQAWLASYWADLESGNVPTNSNSSSQSQQDR